MTRATILAASLLAMCAGLAGAQDVDDSNPRPTLGQRLGNLGRNLFGAEDDNPPPVHRQPLPASRARSRTSATGGGVKSSPALPAAPPEAAGDEPSDGLAPIASGEAGSKLFDPNPPKAGDRSPQAAGDRAAENDAPTSAAALPSSRRRAAAGAAPSDKGLLGGPPPSSPRSAGVPSGRRSASARTDDVVPPLFEDSSSAPLAGEDGRPRPSPLRETPIPRMARSEKHGSSLDREPVAMDDAGHVLITRKSPNISIETTGPRRITIGKEATYTVIVSNVGEVPANDVVVYISVPQWAEVAGSQATSGTTGGGAEKPDGYQWRIGNMQAKSRQELSLRIIPRKSQSFELAVRWTSSPNSSQATVEVEEPKLEMAVKGPAEVIYGEHQIYQLTISNPGTGDAEAVTIQLLPINPGDGGTASHRLGTLPAGTSKTVEVELTARQAGHISIKASATADGGLAAAASQDVLVRRANLQVSIKGPKLHYATSPAAYEVHVKNTGDATAQDFTIVATLPPEVGQVTPSAGGQFEAAGSRIVWKLDDVAAGAETNVSFKCMLKGTGANHIEAMASAGDLKQTATTNTQVMALADLVLDVSDTPGPIPVGDEMAFDVVVRNRGTSSAEQIELVAYFSDGFEPVSVEGGKFELGAGTVLFKPIATLAAGAETSFKIRAKATVAGNHRVRVELQCKSLGTRLTREDSTLFYGEDGALPSSAAAAGDDGPQPHLAPKRE